MPTLKINISTGIEYSPTDGVDSSVKLHNFTVGRDGSLYKLPVLKNLKNSKYRVVEEIIQPSPYENLVWPYRILDISKFQTSCLQLPPPIFPPIPILFQGDYEFHVSSLFRRFVFLTDGSYGVININYDGDRILNSDLPSEQQKFGEFEYDVFNYIPDTPGDPSKVDLSSLSPKILVDFNSQYDSNDQPTKDLRCVFPAQHMFDSKSNTDYNLLMEPRNIIHCSMNATSGNPDPQPLSIIDIPDSDRKKNDIARGCVLIGNRMFFYSTFDNAIYPSAPNDFTKQMKDPDANLAFKIVPSEEIQSLTDFNGNIITFTPTGMERWVLSSVEKTILQRDPTFHFDHRIRYGGSFAKANRDLYYYTDDFHVYRLNSNLTVDQIFEGTLPVYSPLEDYLIRDQTLPMAYFKMLGYRFVSVGPWLYNIDSNTWSTYSFDGWKNPGVEGQWVWDTDTAKQVVAAGYDDIICTYSTICTPLTYEQMADLPFQLEPNLEENEYQWGETAFFTTRLFQDERTFSLDGVEVMVNGGTLDEGSIMWMKILRGSEKGDFDIDDSSTYGIPAYYQTINATGIGESPKQHVGKFVWRTNLKTDRFRLQFVTRERKGIAIEAVLCNLTNIADSQKFLGGQSKQQQEEQKQQ